MENLNYKNSDLQKQLGSSILKLTKTSDRIQLLQAMREASLSIDDGLQLFHHRFYTAKYGNDYYALLNDIGVDAPKHKDVQSLLSQGKPILVNGHARSLLIPMNDERGWLDILVFHFQHQRTPEQIMLLKYLSEVYKNVFNIFELAEHDSLTGLFNRRSFERAVLNFTGIHYKERSHFIIIDIDHFKSINDTMGHLIGDEVLIHIARLLWSNFYPDGECFRFGGEEFSVLLENKTTRERRELLEVFRKDIATHKFPGSLRLTVSSGATLIVPGDYSSELLTRADKALYYSKENGRNKNSCYDELVENRIIDDVNKDSEPQGKITWFKSPVTANDQS